MAQLGCGLHEPTSSGQEHDFRMQKKEFPDTKSVTELSLDVFISHVLRINQFLRERSTNQLDNPDTDDALSQLDVNAFLIDTCLRLVRDALSGPVSQGVWNLLSDILKVIVQGCPKGLNLTSNLRHFFIEWCKSNGIQARAENPGPGSIVDISSSSRKRCHAEDNAAPVKTKCVDVSVIENSHAAEDKPSPASVSGEPSSARRGDSLIGTSLHFALKRELRITDQDEMCLNRLLQGRLDQVLVRKFKLQISRRDIHTLVGTNWLNDNVINFYMELLSERSRQHVGQLPSVHAMNTYFLPRLLGAGYEAVKRWTRNLDLFGRQVIPVPVHSNRQPKHWSMAIIHLRDKAIRYYDSLGEGNQVVLDALQAYLQQESLDKLKQPFDTSGFKLENVRRVPRQYNGHDCGVFCCMFAEYVTRDAPLTFTQEHMVTFRKKMILEIANCQLWP